MPKGKVRPHFQSVQQLGDFLNKYRGRGIFDQKLFRIHSSLEELPKDFERRLHTFRRAMPFHEGLVMKHQRHAKIKNKNKKQDWRKKYEKKSA